MADIKVKIKVGNAEIEAEGPKADVEGILQVWWSSLEQRSPHSDSAPHEQAVDRASPKRSPPKKSNAPSSDDDATNGEFKFDPTQAANQIKQHQSFRAFRDRILHGTNRYNKVALVFYLLEEPLTSGDVDRVLSALGVKIGVGNVSTIIGKHSGDFMNSSPRKAGGAAPKYRLTSHARSELEMVLNEAG